MDVYVLDNLFLPQEVIDVFESVIWTERYSEPGEIELVVASNAKNRGLLVEDTFLSIPDSPEVILVDSISDKNGVLTVKGKTLTDFLRWRIARDTWSTAKSSWLITGRPGDICATVVSQMCSDSSGPMYGNHVLPGSYGTYELLLDLYIGPTDSGGSVYTEAVPYGNVYDAVKGVCDKEGLGFSMRPRNITDGSGQMTFTTYRGLDRTTDQTVNEVVIFDSALDTFTDIEELRSTAGYATAAYAWANGLTAQSQIGVAFAPGTEELQTFKRRSIMVDASDVNAADYTAAQLTSILNQKAMDALANNNYVRMLDGQIVPQRAFKYGRDYNLGDIIELRNASPIASKARITEYIRSQDNTGERAYPTLSVID